MKGQPSIRNIPREPITGEIMESRPCYLGQSTRKSARQVVTRYKGYIRINLFIANSLTRSRKPLPVSNDFQKARKTTKPLRAANNGTAFSP